MAEYGGNCQSRAGVSAGLTGFTAICSDWMKRWA
jgi:hypothetical protein